MVAVSACAMPRSTHTVAPGGGGQHVDVPEREVVVGVAVHDEQGRRGDPADEFGGRFGTCTQPAGDSRVRRTTRQANRPLRVSHIQCTTRIARVPRSYHSPGELTLTTASASPPRPA